MLRARLHSRNVRNIPGLRYTSTTPTLGIRREDKNVWERRVPLVPSQVKEMVNAGIKTIIQPSSIRAFSDEEYQAVGAEIREDLGEAQTILAVKEVPADLLIPDKTYMFFSHTIKAQADNMPLLDVVLQKKVRLIDYEKLTNDFGRIVKFGPYAGYAGMIDSLHAMGISLLARGVSSPFLHVSPAKEYRSLEAARADIQALGDIIRTKGLPKECCPMTIVVTGTGSASQAAQQILHCLPCNYVDARQLKSVWENPIVDRHSVTVAVATASHMVKNKEKGREFDKKEYYEEPEKYLPVFQEDVIPYTRCLVNAMYWEPKYHKLLTMQQASALRKEGRLPLLALGDITCDPNGSVELLRRSTSIADPMYCWDLDKMKEVPPSRASENGVLVVGVDHLPSEFPAEASEYFGNPLTNIVKELALATDPHTLDNLDEVVKRATITCNGSLTPNFEYIQRLRKEAETATGGGAAKSVLILGSGLVSGPVVEYLLKSDPTLTIKIADKDVANANRIVKAWAVGDEGRVSALPLDVEHKDTLNTMIKASNVVISLLPAPLHPMIMARCVEMGRHMVTASYVSPEMEEFSQEIEARGLTFLNELGLDPGIDIMSSMEAIRNVKFKGGEVESYESWCGALAAPDCSDNPMGYKFSWSPMGVMRALEREAAFLWRNQEVAIPGEYLYDTLAPFESFRGYNLFTVPNGNAFKYAKLYGIEGTAHTVMRSTFRFGGFGRMVAAFRALGLLDQAEGGVAAGTASWGQHIAAILKGKMGGLSPNLDGKTVDPSVLAELLGVALRVRNRTLSSYLAEEGNAGLAGYLRDVGAGPAAAAGASGGLDGEVSRMVAGLAELKMLRGDVPISGGASTAPLQALCAHLERELSLSAEETDQVLMHHRMRCHYPADGKRTEYTFTMALQGQDKTRTCTASTVGLPVAIAASLLLKGEIQRKGLLRPIHEEIYQPILAELREEGIAWKENEVTLA